MFNTALHYLKQAIGDNAEFRGGQWEAIELALTNKRALIVQQTGWGKSIVYFIATKMLRDAGKGPTILISPLLALVRNQIENAKKLGIVAVSINSQNVEEWDDVKSKLRDDSCDILLISPEQLANRERISEILLYIKKGIGMFVVDEAHCISDWGHDFRPDYRRITNIIKTLPPNVPVIATTATANQRVVEDIVQQLGNIEVLRGPLVRESLRLQVIRLKDQAERLAWLVENVPKMPGVGIIYCMTIADCNRVSKWLQQNGIDARAYTSKVETEDKKLLEDMFMHNRIKCLVATVALGMGYDKPDIGFVIHFQRPGNIVSYYQQIGRAGRQLENAYAILLNGIEDDEIQEYFINTAFPTEAEMKDVVLAVEKSEDGLKQYQILRYVNMRSGRLDKCIRFLELENIIAKDKNNRYYRTLHPWIPDLGRSETITQRRWDELDQMKQFTEISDCYMKYISEKLDDPYANDCGKCSNCKGVEFFPSIADHNLVIKAVNFLKGQYIEVECRKQWPAGIIADSLKRIPPEDRVEDGRALCHYGDAGWGRFIHDDKYVHNHFRDELVTASAELIRDWLGEALQQMCIAYIPSTNRPELVRSFAQRVAAVLGIPCLNIIEKKANTRQQKELENSAYQCQNVFAGFSVTGRCPDCDIILIDDMVDSKWTLTVCGYLLRQYGARLVYPFAIACTSGMKGDE